MSQEVGKLGSARVINLDFSEVRAVSRAFVQELQVLQMQLTKNGQALNFISANEELKSVLDKVSITKPKEARPELLPHRQSNFSAIDLF